MATNCAVNSPLSGTTGTGNFVGSTSPTLVTPALGTPASGNLSNCTNVPVNQATGTLPAAALPSGTMFNFQQGTLTTPASTSNTSYTDTGIIVSITPTSASNNVLVRAVVQVGGTTTVQSYFQLVRGATPIGIGTSVGSRTACGASAFPTAAGMTTAVLEWLDSPATTSSTTYKVQMMIATPGGASSGTVTVNSSLTDTNSAAFPRAASTISVCEVHA